MSLCLIETHNWPGWATCVTHLYWHTYTYTYTYTYIYTYTAFLINAAVCFLNTQKTKTYVKTSRLFHAAVATEDGAKRTSSWSAGTGEVAEERKSEEEQEETSVSETWYVKLLFLNVLHFVRTFRGSSTTPRGVKRTRGRILLLKFRKFCNFIHPT